VEVNYKSSLKEEATTHLMKIVDELCQILDRVDVVVGGWADERHPSLGVSKPRNVGADFLPRELAALSRLGPLGDLNLDLVRVGKKVRGHTETA
jgi:hypothetical protein